MTAVRRAAALRHAAAAVLAAAVLTGCAACSAQGGSGPSSAPATTAASGSPSPTAASAATASAAARALRTQVDAALGHRLTYLEYLCSVPSSHDSGLVYVALHERTTWRSGGATRSLDAVLAQPVRSTGGGRWTASGSPVPIRSARDHRLAGDAIIGLVGSDHRCSAAYIGPPVSG